MRKTPPHLRGYGFGILVYKRPLCTAGGFFYTVPCHHVLARRGETSQDISLNNTLIMASRDIQDIIMCSNSLILDRVRLRLSPS